MTKSDSSLPYWLVGGTEICEGCLMPYLLQMEYRCDACDRPICEQCVVLVERERVTVACRECEPAAGDR